MNRSNYTRLSSILISSILSTSIANAETSTVVELTTKPVESSIQALRKNQIGDLQYWNGKKWLTIHPINTDAVIDPTLKLCNHKPTWVLYNCPGTSPYEIGETGPAGGRVFYISEGGKHGLEAAPIDQAISGWGCQGKAILKANGLVMGTGANNTSAAVSGCFESKGAIKSADNYSFNGFSDWYLPSKDELKLMYTNIGPGAAEPLTNIGEFQTSSNYWSSSEIGSNHAWVLFFGNGDESFGLKMNPSNVRAIRSF